MNRNLKIVFLSALLLLYAAPSAKADHGSIWEPICHTFCALPTLETECRLSLKSYSSTVAPLRLRSWLDSAITTAKCCQQTTSWTLMRAWSRQTKVISRSPLRGIQYLSFAPMERANLLGVSVAVKSQANLKGYIRFTTSLGAAGVEAGSPATKLLTPVRRSAVVQTALALQNVTDEDGGVSCWLSKGGERVATADFRLAANAQSSQYLAEMFPDYDTMDLVGLLECSTTRRVIGLALDVGADGLSSLSVIAIPTSASSPF